MLGKIIKRNGAAVPYDLSKIAIAIGKALGSEIPGEGRREKELADEVEKRIVDEYAQRPDYPHLEAIQDIVEFVLMDKGYPKTAKKYVLYRQAKESVRTSVSSVLALESDDSRKKDNANVNGQTAMGGMLIVGSIASTDYYLSSIVEKDAADAHKGGDIHIHDLDFYAQTTTCCQIDLGKLLKGGFGNGHGRLREPGNIRVAFALAAIAIQSNQNDQHGGQSIPAIDYYLAPYVAKTYRKLWVSNIRKGFLYMAGRDIPNGKIKEALEESGYEPRFFRVDGEEEVKKLKDFFRTLIGDIVDTEVGDFTKEILEKAEKESYNETADATYQAAEGFIHNLNTMHSRAGGQVPFSSINYGTDTSPEGRLITNSLLMTTERGIGDGETPIFPIQVFKVKEGVSYRKNDLNYDLFWLAIRVSSKRLFPNFSFLDAPFNAQFYKEGNPETEVAYMGCRTRVIANVYDKENEVVTGRGNLSFTSINLPRLALEADGDERMFFEALENMMSLVSRQLIHRMKIVGRKRVLNFPSLMEQGIWLGSENLKRDDEIAGILKHGTLTIGFIGLAETLIALYGKHHGQSEKAQEKGLKIVGFMRDFCDRKSEEYKLNFTLIATPAEGLAGRFTRIDKARFGTIAGVTDRDYYTNSFHVPVHFPIGIADKIRIEAPYHALTNAGHISYVELDGKAESNPSAFETIIRHMKESGIGYGSINHPVDRDPVCGYRGVIDDVCPGCGRTEKESGVPFERIRRITGYLVGSLERWNDAKRAEERDRVKHSKG